METLARELILGEGGKRAAAKATELAASARGAVETGGSSFETLELMVHEACVRLEGLTLKSDQHLRPPVLANDVLVKLMKLLVGQMGLLVLYLLF